MTAHDKNILENFDDILDEVHHLSTKQAYHLPQNVRSLSHLLTDERGARRIGYMNDDAVLGAYTHYFMWWNLFRLTKLFSLMGENAFADLADGDYCLDLGSGPLTVVIALWLSQPELRKKRLIWYCMDISQSAMSLGEEIFLHIVARTENPSGSEAWKIIRVKGEFGTKINNRIRFVTSANMFNELYYDAKMPLEEAAKNYTQTLLKYCKTNNGTQKTLTLIIEPAFPRSSRFISLTRNALLRKGFYPIAPCTHYEPCPMDGRRGGKWCHFSFDANDAPKKLLALSSLSGLQKDKASLSFVLASYSSRKDSEQNLQNPKKLPVRIVSDIIVLPASKVGRYGCSRCALVLVVGDEVRKMKSGDVIFAKSKSNYQIDKKSGAKIVEI